MNDYSVKKILVPIDLSETSLNGFQTAMAIAEKRLAEITLLNVTEKQGRQSEKNKANRDVFNALVNNVKKKGKIRCNLVETEGNVVEAILDASAKDNTDLVIMGTHGASGYREGFVGSNTYQCIKYSSCPVLAIPPQPIHAGFRKILFPLRPSLSKHIPLDLICQFVGENTKLDILGVSLNALERGTALLEKVTDEIRKQLEKAKVMVNVKWGKGDLVAFDVLDYAHTSQPDLVIVTPAFDAISKPDFISPPMQKLIHMIKLPLLFSR